MALQGPSAVPLTARGAAATGGASALLVVDVQRDFVDPREGRLAVPGAPSILPTINRLTASGRFDCVVATRDAHPPVRVGGSRRSLCRQQAVAGCPA